MNFSDWISLRMMQGESTQRFEESMVGTPMSRAGFKSSGVPHGEYKPKNFDRYPFRPDEEKTAQYSDKMRKMVRNDMPICVEALAGYYGNDAIVKAFDDFLTDLEMQGVKL